MHLTGIGFGGLGMSDTDVLQPGQIVTFTVHGTLCAFPGGPGPDDVSTTLNNWAGAMMTLNSVQSSVEGMVPGILDVNVNATVKQQMPAGDLRGQIIAALSAMNDNVSCHNVSLKDNVLNAAPGGTQTPTPHPTDTSSIPWGIVLPSAALLFGAILLTGQRR